jgi:hypothetical protein
MALLNNVIFYLDDVLEVSEMSVAITPELETGTDLEVATESDITLIAEDWQKVERMKATMSGGIMTITARWIKKDSSGSDAWLQQRWLAWQRCIMTIFAGTFVIATQNNNFSGDNTFSGDNIYSGLNTYNGWVVFNGPVSLWTVADFNILWQSNPCPVVESATARDLIYTSPITNDRVYRTDLHAEQIYDSATATWNTQAVWTPTPNASTSVAGIVKIATSSSDPDSTGWIYNIAPLSMIREIISDNSNDLTDATFMLWEPCTKWDSLFKEVWPTFARATTSQNIGDVAANTRVGIPIIWSGVEGNSLKLALAKVDVLWEDLTLRIETDNAGVPSGIEVTDWTATITRASLTTSLTDETITLAWTITLTEWVKYHIVLAQANDTVDPARYFKVGHSTNNTTTRPLNVFDWTDWGTADNDKFAYTSSDLFTDSLLSLTDATYSYKLPNDIPRFAKDNWAIGEKVKCSYLGIVDLFTGLTEWSDYFLQNTPWAIWVTAGTRYYPIWQAETATKLIIWKTKWVRNITANVVYQAHVDWLVVAYWTGFTSWQWMVWYADNTNVTTIVASSIITNNSAVHTFSTTITFFVRAWQYYRVTWGNWNFYPFSR